MRVDIFFLFTLRPRNVNYFALILFFTEENNQRSVFFFYNINRSIETGRYSVCTSSAYNIIMCIRTTGLVIRTFPCCPANEQDDELMFTSRGAEGSGVIFF